MYVRVENLNTGLTREIWEFSLMLDSLKFTIYFDAFYYQTRKSTKHRIWKNQSRWERLNHRENNIERPIIPAEIIEKAKQMYINNLQKTEIEKESK
jgi:hypothetical protein